ncbi:hypothetical protein BH23BAC1_BH23BAC1_04310 [soil metagenome]
MKTTLSIIAFLSFFCLQLFAQNSLVGTWEYKNDSVRSVKIITPTHWVVYAENIKGSETEFIRAHGGTYTITGKNYIENIEVASWDDYGKEKTDFTFKIVGDKFYQKGSLILADGTVYPIDEVWNKVKTPNSYDNNPSVGTWDQLSSHYTMANGTTDSHTNATATRFQIITPTHWMRISHRDNKFENFMGGTYNIYGNKVYPNFEFISYPTVNFRNLEIDQRVEGDKMYWNGFAKSLDGEETFSFEDEFQLVVPEVKIVEDVVKK